MLNKWEDKIKSEIIMPYVFSFPLIVSLTLIFLYPIIIGLKLSLYQDDIFVGALNFINIFKDLRFWHSVYVTFIYVILYVSGVFFAGMITALIVWKAEKLKIRGYKCLQSLITIPYAMPEVVTCIVWLWLLSPARTGFITYLLSLINMNNIHWFQNPNIALFGVLIVNIWQFFPLQTLIILGGFRSIPKETLEAAEIDGASGIIKFFYIVLPQMINIISILMLITLIWSFKRFTTIWLLTGGGPGDATETTAIFIYKNAFTFLKKNYAATAGTILVLITLIIVLLYIVRVKSFEKQES